MDYLLKLKSRVGFLPERGYASKVFDVVRQIANETLIFLIMKNTQETTDNTRVPIIQTEQILTGSHIFLRFFFLSKKSQNN